MRFTKKHQENVRQEIRNLSELHHPRIVNLHADIWEGGDCFLVMDWATGGDLHNKVEQEVKATVVKPFRGLGGNEACTRHVAQQLVDGIAYMHSKHILHRDLKLENVLINSTHMSPASPSAGGPARGFELHDIKITDLGLSKFVGQDDSQPTIVRRNSIVGSPDFVAPEVLSAVYDERADLWSLGVMLYAMFCGQWPFEISSPDHLKPQRHKEIVASIKDSDSWTLVSEEGHSLVQGLLTVDPEERLALQDLKEHPWLYPDLADMVSLPSDMSQPLELKGVVKRISGLSGAALDSVQLRMWDGSKRSHGAKGGETHKEYSLDKDEIIMAVMQETRGQYLGNCLTFYTSRGRSLTVQGKDAKRRQRLVAPKGCQVVGLQFEDSKLIGIITERLTGSGGGQVEEIGGRNGYAVDMVWFKLRGGEVRSYGEPNGTERGPYRLAKDEYVVVVEQGVRDAFLGNSMVFYTSAGHVISFIGVEACPSRRLVAPLGMQVCGIEFKGSHLDRAVLCPADGNTSETTTINVS